MTYYFSKVLRTSFDKAVERVMEALTSEDFGIVSTVDIQSALREGLYANFRRYKIFGACHSPFAYRALDAEDKVGTILPCKIVVQETMAGGVEVSVVDPLVSMQAVKNAALLKVAREVRLKLIAIMETL